MPEVKGVFVGGCVERGVGSSFRRQAHAHNSHKSEWFGWICVRSGKRVLTATGKPTTLMLHEYAHILVPNQGHTVKWAAALVKLGAPAEAKKTRANVARPTMHRHQWSDWAFRGGQMEHRACIACGRSEGRFLAGSTP